MNSMMPAGGRYYEDLVIGEVRESSTRTVTLEELIEFAARYDPQYFHADPIAAKQSIFGELVASGIHSAALWRALDHQISGDIHWILRRGVGRRALAESGAGGRLFARARASACEAAERQGPETRHRRVSIYLAQSAQ